MRCGLQRPGSGGVIVVDQYAGISIEQRGDTDHAHPGPAGAPCGAPASYPAICHSAQQHACHARDSGGGVRRGFSLGGHRVKRGPRDQPRHSKRDSQRRGAGRVLRQLSGVLPRPVHT